MAIKKLLLQYFKRMNVLRANHSLVWSTSCLLLSNAFAQNWELATKSEKTLGLTIASYKYDEPSYMTLKANKVGIDFSGIQVLGSHWPNAQESWFVKGEIQALTGKADYQSPFSGAMSNTPHRSVEVRALLGKDIEIGWAVFAPYVGLGYRQLYSNIGYERTSIYSTLPIGLTHKMITTGLAQMHTTVEYMHLFGGEHKVNLLAQKVRLSQRHGYGLRLSMIHRQDAWSMGPTLTYWNMAQSEVGGVLPVYEPQNKTIELGFKGAYRF